MTQTEQITLYTSPVCPFAHRAEMALAEVGAQFTRYEIKLHDKPEWYARKVNPAGKIPALTYGGPVVPADQPSPESVKLAESLVLVEFIADLFPASPLLPSSPVERAQARFFIDTFNTKFAPAYFQFLWQGKGKDALLAAFEDVQSLLAQGKKFAVNDDCTIADVAVLPLFARLELAFSNDLGAYTEGEGKKVLETLATEPRFEPYRMYLAKLKERESFKKTFKPEIVLAMMKPKLSALPRVNLKE